MVGKESGIPLVMLEEDVAHREYLCTQGAFTNALGARAVLRFASDPIPLRPPELDKCRLLRSPVARLNGDEGCEAAPPGPAGGGRYRTDSSPMGGQDSAVRSA
jgi:hypothetical protein